MATIAVALYAVHALLLFPSQQRVSVTGAAGKILCIGFSLVVLVLATPTTVLPVARLTRASTELAARSQAPLPPALLPKHS